MDRKEKDKIYRKKNKEQIYKYQRKYYSLNKDKYKIYYQKQQQKPKNIIFINNKKIYDKEYGKIYYYKNKVKWVEYEKNYKPKRKIINRKYYLNNIEKDKERSRKYYLNNKDKLNEKTKIYNILNKEKIKVYQKKYDKIYYQKPENKLKESIRNKNRYNNDINYKIICTLRTLTNKALKNKKQHKTINLLGCTILQFKEHLEKQFQPGMTWNNHSLKGWHIDHVIPMSSFNMNNIEEQKKCCYYTNLQPLWAKDNLIKNSKIL